MARTLILLVVLLLVGCGKPARDSAVSFRDFYPERPQSERAAPRESQEFQKVTLAAADMPLTEFCRAIADQTGVSIITEAGLDSQKVTAQVAGQPVDQLLATVARRLGAQVVNRGTLFYIGTLKPEDRGQLVRRVTRLKQQQLGELARLLMSEFGRYWADSDGLLVVADRVEVLARVDEMINSIERSQPGTWVVQFYILTLSETTQRELGLDVSHAVQISAGYARGALANASMDLQKTLSAQFNGLLVASYNKGGSRLLAQPMFLVMDGQTCSIRDGDVVPVPRRSVSDQGTVTIVGYDRIETGLVMDSTIRQVGTSQAQLEMNLSLSQVNGYIQEAPITQQTTFKTIANISQSGIFLIGQLDRKRTAENGTGPIIPTRFRWDAAETSAQIWARVYYVQ